MLIRLSGTLLRHADYHKEVVVDAPTVGDAVETLVQRFPSLRKILFARDGELRLSHRLFLNGESLTREARTRPVKAEDQLDVVTAVAGG
jgi:molybdopterin converting factor small subunit